MRVIAKASSMHPSGVGHVLPLGLEPDFHPPTGGSKMGDAAGFPSPRSSAQSAAGWVRGFWPFGLMPGGPLCIHYLPGLSDNRLTGVGTRACTACRHRSVKKTVCLRCAMTLSEGPLSALASGCFWLDYPDDCSVDVITAPWALARGA